MKLMNGGFRIVALPVETFASLMAADEETLRVHGARWLTADEKPGFPCRVSLADAEVGERVLLLAYAHHEVASPYRASGPIFVRKGASTAHPEAGEIPQMLRSRLLSVRAYDRDAMMVGAEVVAGRELEGSISRWFQDQSVKYLHLHNAKPGCFNCRVERTLGAGRRS